MKHLLSKLPKLLAITGQSGAGKNEVVTIIQTYAERIGRKVYVLQTGDLIREYCKSESVHAQEVRLLYERGERLPGPFVAEMINNHLTNLDAYDHIVINGTPRYIEHCDLLYRIAQDKIWTLNILEVHAENEVCTPRLVNRSKRDRRPDFCTNGVVDEEKIAKKLGWWNANRGDIRRRAILLEVYLCIHNTVHDPEFIQLKNNLVDLFSEQ